jgi:hypothetical protein
VCVSVVRVFERHCERERESEGEIKKGRETERYSKNIFNSTFSGNCNNRMYRQINPASSWQSFYVRNRTKSNVSRSPLYHVGYLSTLLYKVDPVIWFIQPGSTHFKDSATLVSKQADPPSWWKSSTPSPLNLDPVYQSGLTYILYYSKMFVFEVQLLRNQISSCQHVFYYIYTRHFTADHGCYANG